MSTVTTAPFTAQMSDLWQDPTPIRAELFGVERMEHHARTLAAAQPILAGRAPGRLLPGLTPRRLSLRGLSQRISANGAVLLEAYKAAAASAQAGQSVTPAAEWLLDNYHLVEQQLQQIHDDLPPGYYRQLPKLADGPFAGYPRVFGIAWAYVAHTDSLLSAPVLTRFVQAYQQVQPLMIGELWAMAITLRIVLVENMRRLAVQITEGHRLRLEADALVDRVIGSEEAPPVAFHLAVAAYEDADLPEIIAAQIAKRLRGRDPADTPLRGWLEDRLRRQGSSIDEVVAHAQVRQGASNVTMRNIVTSMRLASELDWADFFEEVSLIDARLREHPGYGAMDFATRNLYRTAIENLARGSTASESGVADAALALAADGTTDAERDPGHALIGPGRALLEQRLAYRAPLPLRLRRWLGRPGLPRYLSGIALVAVLLLATGCWATGGPDVWLLLFGIPLALEAALAIVHLIVTRTIAPERLPALDLSHGVPDAFRTLIAVPVLLTDPDQLQAQVERLEVHHLSSAGGALHYALLLDGSDAPSENMPQDADMRAAARTALDRLNAAYPSPRGDRFFILHRRRHWNEAQGVWMGWERKRGTLVELNRALRGATDTSLTDPDGNVPALPQNVAFVITLDADTRLLRDTVSRLIGKIAHPLNRAVFDPSLGHVTHGYGIVQPRVTPSLPNDRKGSLFQRVFSSPGGIEPYAAAISDVYQDLFGQGSFTGKGIYDIDAFESSLAGRVPENTLLSHDLFEGTFARTALATDIEVVEDFPARHDVAAQRQHRWVRGDWQLWPWVFGRFRQNVPALGRWKMIDNLRRSLTAPLTLLALFAGWLTPAAPGWTLWVLTLTALPRLLPLPFAILPGRAGITARSHLAALRADLSNALWQIGHEIAILADTALQMGDAIVRTVARLGFSRRNLLEWTTAAQAAARAQPGLWGTYRRMGVGVALGLGTCALAVLVHAPALPVVAPFALLWVLAPAIAWRISQPGAVVAADPLTASEILRLRTIARRTWRFFETFVTADENHLPPDNFQETPRPVVAHRTSPTNIGLYLLSTVVARDMGWIGTRAALDRIEQTLTTIEAMPQYRGHLYNWYDTQTLRVLDPAYVSSVDSGNLAGHLIAVAQACRDWHSPPTDAAICDGVSDALRLAMAAGGGGKRLADALSDLSALLQQGQIVPDMADTARRAHDLTEPDTDAAFWTNAICQRLADLDADKTDLSPRLDAVAARARAFALNHDFAFLVEPEKKLLSIGFSAATFTLDTNCYDLLASEARLASLFAIAKGDVETRHWFRLGRPATPYGTASALISWSGSMFEYLMPSLVLRAPVGSVLEQTNRLIVTRQQDYARARGIPWGISESAYVARDIEMTYQYSNFGVPGLGLKRGLADNLVIAPYATGLAAMIDPKAAVRNFDRLADLGAEGCHGFYEAIDFTRARLPEGVDHVIVRSFMAHHQGMTITAIANTILDAELRRRFHAEPMIQGVDLLLQERVPRDARAAPPKAEETRVFPAETVDTPSVRRFDTPALATPTAHLLSNGTYSVMITPHGTGYSRWGGMAVTRWRPEADVAALGSFILHRDTRDGAVFSSALRPVRSASGNHSAVFCEHHAAFTRKGAELTSVTEVIVSGEDNAEARRVTLTNTGRRPHEVDLTSYAELVLAPQSADLAHPAFSKMFVVTEHLPELGVIIATRRRRSPHDPQVWAAHIAVVEGTETAPQQIETDRARFIGRGRSLAQADLAKPMSGTIGTVLDPIFAIRTRLSVPPGGMARVTFWTMVADTSAALLDLVERHRDPSAFERAETLAWTQSQVQLRHLGITRAEASVFQRLSGLMLRGSARLRAPAPRILAGIGPQSGLWQMGISGDLPILVLLIDDAEDIARVHEALAAHEYWRMRQVAIDLVILNERSSSYVQDLQIAIEGAVRSAQSRPRSETEGGAVGNVYALRTDLITPQARALLVACAGAILVASRGGIATQLDASAVQVLPDPPALPAPSDPEPAPDLPTLEFFNDIGGFDRDGREYVTILRNGQTTPAPWINVIANPGFGFHVSADGAGSTWAENSRENQLTPWSNDPVSDPAGEAVYLHDLDSGKTWTPTALPIRSAGTYIARHGFGYSRFSHAANGIAADLVQLVPLSDPVKISHLTLSNTTSARRRLSVTGFAEWVLGPSRSATAGFVTTEVDPETGAILARNPYGMAFPGRVAFADLAGASSVTADRAEFLGNGGMTAPSALRKGGLSGKAGPALDPCAALQRVVTLEPGETATVTFLIGQAADADAARALITRTRATDVQATLANVTAHWDDLLTAVQIKTPDRAMDIMLNGWLLYQTLACRIWARAGFYQASGAYGFRDQLQDGMALTFSRPDMTRSHLLRAAARQFPEGDVQHWWLPHSGQGVRTRISDDRVWLGYGVARYIDITGDAAILDEVLPFLDGPALRPGAHDDFFQPGQSDQSAPLFEHCARGLDQAIALTGDNGMPLIGTGDWNDGMNRVGEGGKGTSVWLGWLLIATLRAFAPLADTRDPARAARWRAHADSVAAAIEAQGWDGEWYRRGTYDDGSLLGSATSDECRIDSIAQSWSVLSGAADPARAKAAMQAVSRHLIRKEPGLALLFAPPFDKTPHDPGYIKGYPPGLRENGGQYSHAAMWVILAQARLGNGDAAAATFALLNPVNHALTADDAAHYKVEPYVVAADVYSTAPHEGRGGWTWYTGSAGWMYRAGIEGLLGLTRRGDMLHLNPCLPLHWPGIEASVRHDGATLTIRITNGSSGQGIASATLNDEVLDTTAGLWLRASPGDHRLEVTLR